MKYNKIQALNIIVLSAKIFDSKLKDKELLFISKQDKKVVYYEMQFLGSNFKHFTGVESNLSANRFYKLAIDERLSVKDFEFKDNFLVEKKMKVLEAAVNLPYTARMIGDFNYAGIKIQADIGSGNNRFTMGFRKDENGRLYPISVLQEDIRKSTNPTAPIIATLSKNIGEKIYHNLTYKSKNINFDKLHIPKELKNIISDNILNQLVPQKNLEEIGELTKETVIKDIIVPEGKKQEKEIRKKKCLSERMAEGKLKAAEHNNKIIKKRDEKSLEQER